LAALRITLNLYSGLTGNLRALGQSITMKERALLKSRRVCSTFEK
jgi:hypothetical protein